MTPATMKCDGCGLESGQAGIFQSARSLLGYKSRMLCPACFAENDFKIHLFLFWTCIAVLLLALLLAVCLPAASLGPWLLNLALFQLFIFVGTVMHELGHVTGGPPGPFSGFQN